MRMMVIFEKGFALRHIGHLDLMRTMQRALRRSGLPLVYSKGFNPHIELSFASPLGVGTVGLREVADIPLEAEVSEAEFVEKLNAAVPSCMPIRRARRIEPSFPTLMALVAASRYTLRFPPDEKGKQIAKRLPEFMALSEYMAMRKTKSGEKLCNIRPFVQEAEAAETNDSIEIRCVLEATQLGNLKPSLFAKCLAEFAEVGVVPCVAIREDILCRGKDGSLAAMEEYRDVW